MRPAGDPGGRRIHPIGISVFSSPVVRIRANVTQGGPGPGWDTPVLTSGMELFLGDGSVVAGNTIRRTDTGILTGRIREPAPRAVVRDNLITDGTPGGVGLLILDDASTYSGNRVTGYDVGVLLDDGEARLRGNDFRGNGRWDCVDEAPGLAIWVDNIGDKSDPPGICSPAP